MAIKAFIDRLASRLHCDSARREAVRELSNLTDRQLDDIGLYRGAIRGAVDAQLVARGCSSRIG